jgi:hypothetical protein
MRKKIKELGVCNVPLDILETSVIKRDSPKKMGSQQLTWNAHLQTTKFVPDDYFKPIEPCIEK